MLVIEEISSALKRYVPFLFKCTTLPVSGFRCNFIVELNKTKRCAVKNDLVKKVNFILQKPAIIGVNHYLKSG